MEELDWMIHSEREIGCREWNFGRIKISSKSSVVYMYILLLLMPKMMVIVGVLTAKEGYSNNSSAQVGIMHTV